MIKVLQISTLNNLQQRKKINITSAGGSIYVGDDGYAYTSDGQDYTLAPLVNNADVTIVDTAVHASKAESIDVYGGHNINITTNVANIQVGSDYYRWNSDNNSPNYSEKFSANPTGTVNITSTATDYSGIYVHGGTDVTVTAANAEVQVGVAEDQTWASNPTGNVSVTETKAVTYDGGLNSAFDSNSNGWVQIGGGVNATVNAKGQNVAIGVERTVGDVMTTPSGAITVNQSAVLTGTNGIANGQGYIDINGGTNVTVNTTGGGVDIGWAWYGNNSTGYYTAPTGNVSITDTFSGPNTDWLFTLGGAAVNITTTATSGYIVVGGTNGSPDASLALNDAGTALKNPTYAATGNVAIVNQTTSGVFHLNNSGWSENDPTNTKYGTSDVTVYTNGSQTVSVAGADNAYITDVNTVWATAGDKAGLAVGTSKLATVNLTGVMNSATITSDVFANLNVKDSYVNIDIDNNATAAANLAVSVANSDIWVTNHSNATAVTVTSLAGDTSWFGMDDNSTITTLTFNNAGTLNVWNGDGNEGYNDNLGALTTIVAKGSGTLNLGIVSYDGDDTTLNKVDASQASGAVNVAFNPDDVEFIGGQGNDTVTLLSYFDFGNDSINNQTVIDGGLGANTLEINYEGNGESFKAADGFTHFQTLRFGQVATDVNPNENGDTGENYAYGTFNTTGYSNIEVGYIYDTLYLNHLSNAGTVTILGATGRNGATNLWTYNVNLGLNTTSTAATFTVNLGTVGGAENVGKSSDYQVVNAGVWDGGGTLKTFNLVSQGKASGTNYVELNTSNVTTLNISGATNLTLSTDDSARYSTIDAHLSSGNVNVVDVQTADGNVTLLGGSGLLTADISGGDATAVDTVTSGSGGVHVELGLGGAWDNANANGSQNGISYYGASSAGSETVNLSASVAAVDTLGVGAGVNAVKSGSVGGVTGFQTIASTKADVLEIGGYQLANTSGAASSHVVGDLDTAYLAIGFDPSGSMLSKLSNLYYTASNGVITFSAATGHNDLLSDTTLLQRAAELIVQSAANDNSERTTAIFNVGGNSYVVSANAGSISESIVRPTLTVYGSAWSNNAYIACHVNGVEIGFNIGTWDPSAHDIAVTLANLINDHFQYYSPTASGPIATVNGSGSTITLALATSLVPGGYLFTGGTAEPDAVEFSINNVRSVTTYDNTSVVELLGNTTVGFGDTAAGNTILSDVIQQVADSSTSGVYDSVNSTSANEIYKAGGFSEIYLHDGDFGSKTTTVNSLAASGVLDVGYTNVESAVAVNQLGASGQNSLTVNFGNYADLKSLTLNGDWTAILNNDNSSSVYIHELVDATNTISTLALHDHASGSNSYTEINKITSTSLTTIDATDLANFQLGNGTDWSNSSLNNATVTGLTQSNLTVKLGDVYSADIVATGNHVTFTQTTGASVYDNDLYIQANGAANTFNVNGGYIMANGAGDTFNIGASNQTVYVEAAGAGDTFNIKGNAHVAGLNYLHTGDFMTATGANDTFTITGSGDVYMWAGSNAVINLGTASSAFGGYLDLTIKGDVTGTTSAGSYAYTTLNLGNLQGNYSIELNSNLYSLNNVNDGYYYTSGGAVDTNFGDSLVNVATATSLAQALDIAAAQGASAHGGTLLAHTSVLDWFQFGGNTYIVEANNITAVDAAHTGLGANDVVIKITGLVDLSGLDIYSGALNTIQY